MDTSSHSDAMVVSQQQHMCGDAEDEVADVMQTLASSYDVAYTSFDGCMKSLLSRGVNDLNKAPPPRAGQSSDSASQTRPFWHTCVSKFHTAYLKAFRQSGAFKKMMMSFFTAHADELCRPLFTEDDDSIADGFFKRTDRFAGPLSAAARTASAAATGTSNVLVGPVVYFDMTSSQLASVCIPIGEMYRAAIKQYISAPASNLKKKLLPTLTLLDFYAVIYHSMDETHPSREHIERNLADLCEAAEAVAPGSGPGAAASMAVDAAASNPFAGTPLDAIAKMFSGGAASDSNGGLEGAFGSIAGIVSSLAAVGGVNPGVAGDMTNAIKSVGSSVKTLVDKLSEIKKDGESGGEGGSMPIDNEQFVDALGAIFQSGEVKQQLTQTLKTASAVFGALSGNAPPSSSTTDGSPSSEGATTTVEEVSE